MPLVFLDHPVYARYFGAASPQTGRASEQCSTTEQPKTRLHG
jgi:hypothetical protein